MATGAVIPTTDWRTKTIIMSGGERLDVEPVLLDNKEPGALIDSQNFESGLAGGYKRTKGYALYSSSEVPGTGRNLGVFVHNNGVLACRDDSIYHGTTGTWGSDIAPAARTSAGQYRAVRYTWSAGKRICLVDGVNDPVRFIATTGTELSNAPTGAPCVEEFKNRLVFGKGGILTYSVADDDTDYTTNNGGGAINIGDTITGFGVWRKLLIIFCEGSIHRLAGSSASDFVVEPITEDFGCLHPDTIKGIRDDVVFLGPDGIRTVSATVKNVEVGVEAISTPVNQHIQDQMSIYQASGNISAITVANKSQYRLFWSASTVAATSAIGLNACLNRRQGTDEWEFFKLKGIQVATGDSGRLDNNSELVVHSGHDGYVYSQETGDNYNNANISAYIQLPYLYLDDPALRKIFYRLKLIVDVEGSAVAELTTTLLLDDNDSTILQPSGLDMTSSIPTDVAVYGFTGGVGTGSLYGTMVYGQGASKNYRTGLVGGGQNGSLKISSNDTLPSYAIQTAILEYELGAR